MSPLKVMKKSIILVPVTAFWLLMMTLFVQREFFQLTPIKAPYEVLPILQAQIREEYRGIYLGDNLIGFLLTVLEKKEPGNDLPEGASYELRQNTYMTFLFLGHEREMLVRSKAYLDERLELLAFEVKITSGEHWTEMTGQVSEKHLNMVISGKEGSPVRKIIPIERPLFFSESVSMIWTPQNLKTGKQGRLRVWNPLLLNFEDMEFRVGRKTRIQHEGEEKEVYTLSMSEQGMETVYWITPEGVVLKHESPTGLIMLKQEAWKIFDGLREGRDHMTDLPNLYSVASNRELENPEALTKLRVQILTPEGPQEKIMTRPDFEKIKDFLRPVEASPEMLPYLAAGPFIQSDSPAIVKTAQTVAGEEPTVLRASLKLMHWVHDWVSPIPTVSLPSAQQVLDSGKGDCNEYTALFTALARALGIPTKMTAGLVYQKGRFFYHAWPEVYAGKWVALDPTFNQAPADVTHIPLIEGNLEEQVALIQQLGKIKIEILEAV